MELIKLLRYWPITWYYLYKEKQINKIRAKIISGLVVHNAIGAELGVFKGRFSPYLLKHTKAARLHLIDPWYLLTARWNWATGNKSTVNAVRKILKKLRKEIENHKVIIHIGDDRDILKTFPNNYFDWVYLDSSHHYQHTIDELAILKDKVKDSGIIVGDDWNPNPEHRHHGVYKAVKDFVLINEYSILYSNEQNKQWAIKKN